MEPQNLWPILKNAQHIIYMPQPLVQQTNWFHPFLGYPTCPLIGRYNKNQYRIGETRIDFQFKCHFDQVLGQYKCGDSVIHLPEIVVERLRNIPEIIPFNRPKNLKKADQIHPIAYPVEQNLSFHWIISFGDLGKDFLSYINHTYLFDQQIFNGPKLLHTTFNLPIFVFMPEKSGLAEKQVERGISIEGFRSEYLSIHLKGGAPAFSPNNMRLGIEGMKEVKTGYGKKEGDKSNQGAKKNKKNRKKQRQNAQMKQNREKEEKQFEKQNEAETKDKGEQLKNEEFFGCNFLEEQIFEESPYEKVMEKQEAPEVPKKQHQKYVHFYSSILLPKDHRVYYHWHIEDESKQEIVRELIQSSSCIKDLVEQYSNVLGVDSMIEQILRLGLG